MHFHKCKGHFKLLCSLTRQGKSCECHPAHSFLFINVLGGGYFLLFHQSTMHIIRYIAFDKCFYNCDVVVEKSL